MIKKEHALIRRLRRFLMLILFHLEIDMLQFSPPRRYFPYDVCMPENNDLRVIPDKQNQLLPKMADPENSNIICDYYYSRTNSDVNQRFHKRRKNEDIGLAPKPF
jgi:hypothetical protein